MCKWVEALPISDQSTATVSDVLIKDVFCRYGLPRAIHSDQGVNFTSTLIQNICDRLLIDKTRTCPYTPASNGLVERANRWIADALSKIIEDHRDWDNLVSLACLFYRASQHKATCCSPTLLALRREVRLPIDVQFPTGEIEKVSVPEYLEKLEERKNIAAEFARKNMELEWETREANSQF
jgi:transposase InsO family protein